VVRRPSTVVPLTYGDETKNCKLPILYATIKNYQENIWILGPSGFWDAG
jgi:hypothetical protein